MKMMMMMKKENQICSALWVGTERNVANQVITTYIKCIKKKVDRVNGD